MPFEAVAVRIKVIPDSTEQRTAGGIWIPEAVQGQEKQAITTGTVVNVGSGCWDGVKVVKSGDHILFAKYGGMIFMEDGKEYRFINDADVIAIER